MYGAIFGDIIGSRFEFDRGKKTKDFELFTDECKFTDDTVMTIAVAKALLSEGNSSESIIKYNLIKQMKEWGKNYPKAGYGRSFRKWLSNDIPYDKSKPYGSYGNGSAMRVSAVGWLYDNIKRTREVARMTAEVTHNHPEGIKGAECTAAVIFLARNGVSKEAIEDYVIEEFGYDFRESLDEMRRRHAHVETCQDSLPKALRSFFDGESYEDVVRNAVSLGGDTDTIAAIAGSMAEAFYGVPLGIMIKGMEYLPDDMKNVLKMFSEATKENSSEKEDDYENNKYIKMAVSDVYEAKESKAFLTLLDVLIKRMTEDGMAPTPMVDANNVFNTLDIEQLTVGKSFSFDQEMRLIIDTMQDKDGNQWIPLFTDYDELNKGVTANIIIDMAIHDLLESGLHSDRANGVVINPFGQALTLTKDVLEVVMKIYDDNV